MQRVTRPPEIVSNRLLTAEATAAAALALVQRPAMWEALTTLGTLLETVVAHRSLRQTSGHIIALPVQLDAIIQDCAINVAEAEEAVALLNILDAAARGWALLAFPGQHPTDHPATPMPLQPATAPAAS